MLSFVLKPNVLWFIISFAAHIFVGNSFFIIFLEKLERGVRDDRFLWLVVQMVKMIHSVGCIYLSLSLYREGVQIFKAEEYLTLHGHSVPPGKEHLFKRVNVGFEECLRVCQFYTECQTFVYSKESNPSCLTLEKSLFSAGISPVPQEGASINTKIAKAEAGILEADMRVYFLLPALAEGRGASAKCREKMSDSRLAFMVESESIVIVRKFYENLRKSYVDHTPGILYNTLALSPGVSSILGERSDEFVAMRSGGPTRVTPNTPGHVLCQADVFNLHNSSALYELETCASQPCTS